MLNLVKRKDRFSALLSVRNTQIRNFNPLIIVAFLVLFSGLFLVVSNTIAKKNKQYSNNFQEIVKDNEFSNFTSYLLSKLNSPYEEINYVIQNNDTVEKILKKFKVRNIDIKAVNIQLKEKKLSNIYSGRKLNLIIKKLDDKNNTLVNLVYPINNTTSVDRRLDNTC